MAVEIARLVTAYTSNLQRHEERIGYIPTDLLSVKPYWAIEAVATRLTTEAIRQILGRGEPPCLRGRRLS